MIYLSKQKEIPIKIYRQTTKYLQKCIVCNRVGHDMYIMTTDEGQSYLVCSQEHARELDSKGIKEITQPVDPLKEPNQDPNYE
jgi:hypothetical protein